MKRLVCLACLSMASPLFAGEALPLQNRPTELRLGFETLTMPGREKMGMVGGSYLLEAGHGVYVGPAAYGALTGQRGGFFTGGVEAAWRMPLWQKIELEPGVYVGGGGGGSAPVGGGMMVRPHVDLFWRLGAQRVGISASQVNFPNGHIQSRQLGLVWSLDDRFFYTAPGHIGQSTSVSQRGGAGMDRLAAQFGVYKPMAGTLNTGGLPMNPKVAYVGFRMEQFLNPHWLWGLESAGAASGGADGYAEVLGSLAWETPLAGSWLSGGVRTALGMGGGGKVDTGGGLLGKAGAYGKFQLSRSSYLMLDGGLAYAPDGRFKAKYANLLLGMELDRPAFPLGAVSPGSIEGWEWGTTLQNYHGAQRYGGARRNLQNIGFKLNRQIGGGAYLSGQAHSALGGGAGGFSVGLIGLGWESEPAFGRLRLGTELLGGAAGGGGVDTKGGAIVQPMALLGVDLGSGWVVKAGYGRVKSVRGELNAPVGELGLSFKFGLPRR